MADIDRRRCNTNGSICQLLQQLSRRRGLKLRCSLSATRNSCVVSRLLLRSVHITNLTSPHLNWPHFARSVCLPKILYVEFEAAISICPSPFLSLLLGPWGHSGPLCHALSLSLSWTSMRRRRATVQLTTVPLAVANGPNIFQMLLVFSF